MGLTPPLSAPGSSSAGGAARRTCRTRGWRRRGRPSRTASSRWGGSSTAGCGGGRGGRGRWSHKKGRLSENHEFIVWRRRRYVPHASPTTTPTNLEGLHQIGRFNGRSLRPRGPCRRRPRPPPRPAPRVRPAPLPASLIFLLTRGEGQGGERLRIGWLGHCRYCCVDTLHVFRIASGGRRGRRAVGRGARGAAGGGRVGRGEAV